MKWLQQIPTEPGWYWRRKIDGDYEEPECVKVRDYAGSMAIGNCLLEGWKSLYDYEWAGPIPLPKE